MIFPFFLRKRLPECIFYAAKILSFRKRCALIARYLVNVDLFPGLAMYLLDFI
jgi:hypothetical protein